MDPKLITGDEQSVLPAFLVWKEVYWSVFFPHSFGVSMGFLGHGVLASRHRFNMFQSWVIHGLDGLDGFQISSLNEWPCRTFPISLIDTIFDLAQNVSDWMLGAGCAGLPAGWTQRCPVVEELDVNSGWELGVGLLDSMETSHNFFVFWGLRLGYHTHDWLVVTGSFFSCPIGNVIIPIDEDVFGWVGSTTNQNDDWTVRFPSMLTSHRMP